MSTTTEDAIREFGHRWVDAEENGDVAALDAMSTADVTVVGPLGFVLDKTQWLDRYRSGAFTTSSLTWDEVTIRSYGETAVAIGRHTQQAAYQGNPADGQFRSTHILVRVGDRWLLAGAQLSPIGGRPPFARPAS